MHNLKFKNIKNQIIDPEKLITKTNIHPISENPCIANPSSENSNPQNTKNSPSKPIKSWMNLSYLNNNISKKRDINKN